MNHTKLKSSYQMQTQKSTPLTHEDMVKLKLAGDQTCLPGFSELRMDTDLISEMTKANRMSMAKSLRMQALDR
jgi:hypothetical protein